MQYSLSNMNCEIVLSTYKITFLTKYLCNMNYEILLHTYEL